MDSFLHFLEFGFVLFRDYFCTCLFCFLIMTTERDDSLPSVSVRLDGKNYSYWSYVMRNFLKAKKLWGYVIGTCET